MSKQLIENISVASKELITLELAKKRKRPEDLSVAIFLGIKTKEEDAKKEFSQNDILPVFVEISVKMFDQTFLQESKDNKSLFDNDADDCFKCRAVIKLRLKFKANTKYKEPVLPKFSEEVVSLAYDDLRIIIEDSINRTSYRGFYLPDDFRDVAAVANDITPRA